MTLRQVEVAIFSAQTGNAFSIPLAAFRRIAKGSRQA
jgi:hypothetical protein